MHPEAVDQVTVRLTWREYQNSLKEKCWSKNVRPKSNSACTTIYHHEWSRLALFDFLLQVTNMAVTMASLTPHPARSHPFSPLKFMYWTFRESLVNSCCCTHVTCLPSDSFPVWEAWTTKTNACLKSFIHYSRVNPVWVISDAFVYWTIPLFWLSKRIIKRRFPVRNVTCLP